MTKYAALGRLEPRSRHLRWPSRRLAPTNTRLFEQPRPQVHQRHVERLENDLVVEPHHLFQASASALPRSPLISSRATTHHSTTRLFVLLLLVRVVR